MSFEATRQISFESPPEGAHTAGYFNFKVALTGQVTFKVDGATLPGGVDVGVTASGDQWEMKVKRKVTDELSVVFGINTEQSRSILRSLGASEPRQAGEELLRGLGLERTFQVGGREIVVTFTPGAHHFLWFTVEIPLGEWKPTIEVPILGRTVPVEVEFAAKLALSVGPSERGLVVLAEAAGPVAVVAAGTLATLWAFSQVIDRAQRAGIHWGLAIEYSRGYVEEICSRVGTVHAGHDAQRAAGGAGNTVYDQARRRGVAHAQADARLAGGGAAGYLAARNRLLRGLGLLVKGSNADTTAEYRRMAVDRLVERLRAGRSRTASAG